MSATRYLDAFDHEWVLEKLSAVNGNEELFQFIDGLFDPRFTLKQAGIKNKTYPIGSTRVYMKTAQGQKGENGRGLASLTTYGFGWWLSCAR